MKVRYLPYIKAMQSVEFLNAIDAEAYSLYPSSLSDNWHSFSIQICGKAYSLPLPLSDLLTDGWMVEDEYADHQLRGADEPYEEYDEVGVDLTNAEGKRISVQVSNTTEKTIDIQEGTVGRIYVVYGNLDFAGADLQITGGLMLGWSTKTDVEADYGKPDEDLAGNEYEYIDEDCETSFYRLGFSEEGVLEDISIRNLPYRRDAVEATGGAE